MNQVVPMRVRARWVRPAGLLLIGVAALTVGLFAVGPGHLYRGDTWPDYLVMLAASVLVLAAAVDGAARDEDGAWSWRTLRGPAVKVCGVALLLLVVLTAIDPVDPGIWPQGDSAQGFSVFTFLGSLAIAIAARVYAPRDAGVTELAWAPAAGSVHAPGPVRIALRRFRFLSRQSYVDVDATGATLVVPRVFGGRRHWFIPIEAIGVVFPDGDAARENDRPEHGSDDQWVTRQEFRVPYLSTTSPMAAPNLLLLFTVPQPIPPIRWFARSDLGLSWRATRSPAGVRVDGVELRVVNSEAATQALLAHDAHAIAHPDAFVQQHRDVLRDPDQVRAVVADERRSVVLWVCSGVATLALFIAFKVTDDERYAIGMAAAVIVSWLLQRATNRHRTP